MSPTETALVEQAWSSLVGDHLREHTAFPDVRGSSADLQSHFAVSEVATACVATALMAASALQRVRGDRALDPGVDRAHVAAAVRSERYFRLGASPAPMGFAPLSRFWQAADGWVRTHANFPWHRDALLAALGVGDDAGSLEAAIAEQGAADIESRVVAAGGVAAAVRSLEQWRVHPQGQAVAAEPLISHRIVGPAVARRRPSSDLPAAGVRVLDLTRVIAGPVCTRYLAALGADVLRVDPPHRPDFPLGAVGDTLLSKRSTILDATTEDGAATLARLAREADVIVCGYRPGALERYGLGEVDLAEHNPGVVVVYLDAWGHSGPWADRRGFDSIVQAPVGIAMAESADGLEPGGVAMPASRSRHRIPRGCRRARRPLASGE